MDRCTGEKTVGINTQTIVRKESLSKGCEDGQESVLMLTGPEATIEHTTCNNGGGLNLGGRPGKDGGGQIILLKAI